MEGKLDGIRNCNFAQLLKRLTDELRSAENVFKIVAKVDLVCQAEVDELNAWVRHVPIQQHDVFRLERKRKVHVIVISTAFLQKKKISK